MILLALAAIPLAWWLGGRAERKQREREFETMGIRYQPRWNEPRTEREAWERLDLDDAMAWERDERGETQYR